MELEEKYPSYSTYLIVVEIKEFRVEVLLWKLSKKNHSLGLRNIDHRIWIILSPKTILLQQVRGEGKE